MGMKIIESPRIPSFNSEEGIYVVLPMLDPTYLDSVVRIRNEMKAWQYNPHEMRSFGSNFVKCLDQTLYMLESKETFLRCLMKVYPEDYEFFLWHPEVHRENKYYR